MSKSVRIALVLHGDFPVEADLRTWADEADHVVATDGAAGVLLEHGITPDVVIGDMDGIREDTLQVLEPHKILAEDDQNTTDFQKAIAYASRTFNSHSIAVLNFEGRLLDHVLSNLYAARPGMRFIGSAAQIIPLGVGDHALASRPGLRVSLMPLPEARIDEALGLAYDPSGLNLGVGGRDGVSNQATSDEIRLTIASGALLAFVQRFEGEPRW